ncbi:MAG: response regulator transcription factor [Rhodobacteraceae bacterium]|nr:response regulator transcription factor [Paracoccaceae bacterium]
MSSMTEWALIVDDHPLYCDALELTLKSVSQFSQILTASRLGAALALIAQKPAPSLIVLDLNLPDVRGMDGLVRLKTEVKDCPVIVVSSMGENAVIGAALRAGASGFVPKHSSRSVFREALNVVSSGQVFKPSGYVEVEEPPNRPSSIEQLASLTRQQTRILEFICNGKLNKQIAFDLSITEATVKAHVTAIMRKLGVQNRTQAVLVAQEARFANLLQGGD